MTTRARQWPIKALREPYRAAMADAADAFRAGANTWACTPEAQDKLLGLAKWCGLVVGLDAGAAPPVVPSSSADLEEDVTDAQVRDLRRTLREAAKQLRAAASTGAVHIRFALGLCEIADECDRADASLALRSTWVPLFRSARLALRSLELWRSVAEGSSRFANFTVVADLARALVPYTAEPVSDSQLLWLNSDFRPLGVGRPSWEDPLAEHYDYRDAQVSDRDPGVMRLRDAIGTRSSEQLFLWDEADSPFDSLPKLQRMLSVIEVALGERPYTPGELRFRDDRTQPMGAEEVSDLY